MNRPSSLKCKYKLAYYRKYFNKRVGSYQIKYMGRAVSESVLRKAAEAPAEPNFPYRYYDQATRRVVSAKATALPGFYYYDYIFNF